MLLLFICSESGDIFAIFKDIIASSMSEEQLRQRYMLSLSLFAQYHSVHQQRRAILYGISSTANTLSASFNKHYCFEWRCVANFRAHVS
jgi:hypothetical protein